MSIEALTWALTVPVGGNAKVVLFGLANHAHPDGTETYPALDTLAKYAHCDRSTARRNVRKLVGDGWAIPDGLGPQGQTKYRLPLDRGPDDPPLGGGGKTPPPDEGGKTPRGGTSASEGVAPAPPEPSFNRPSREEARAAARQRLPEDFPAELIPHARAVFRILRQIATEHNAREVYPLAVGRVVAAHPRKPLVAQAQKFAVWAVDPPRAIRDVVATYTTFLERERDLAAIERLTDDGTPAELPPGVTPIRRGQTPPLDNAGDRARFDGKF